MYTALPPLYKQMGVKLFWPPASKKKRGNVEFWSWKENKCCPVNQWVGIRSALKPNYFFLSFFVFLLKTCPLHIAPLIKLAPTVPSTPTPLMCYHRNYMYVHCSSCNKDERSYRWINDMLHGFKLGYVFFCSVKRSVSIYINWITSLFVNRTLIVISNQ